MLVLDIDDMTINHIHNQLSYDEITHVKLL